MKIGTFARKFKLNPSTVRYYINSGLIVPDREGGQYVFNKDCIQDMEKILKYKKYYFSLEEIRLLFFLEKASRFKDEIVLGVCADILKNRRDKLIEQRDQLNNIIDDLNIEIENLPSTPNKEAEDIGIVYSFIPFLYCPYCQIPLKLDSANLYNGGIQKGLLWCECGYKATIDNGIVLCKDYDDETPFKAFENVNSIIAMKQQFSATYRLLISQTYLYMYNKIANKLEESRHIMAGPFTLNFLLESLEKLGEDHIYIIFDPSLKRINKLKKYLALSNYKIIFIAGKAEELPIKHSTIDIYIDDYSTTNSMFTYSTFNTEHISPLLKNNAEVVGIFTTYLNSPKSINNFKQSHPGFDPSKMALGTLKHHWSENGVRINDVKLIGKTTPKEIHYPQDEIGEWVEVHGYRAKKISKKPIS